MLGFKAAHVWRDYLDPDGTPKDARFCRSRSGVRSVPVLHAIEGHGNPGLTGPVAVEDSVTA